MTANIVDLFAAAGEDEPSLYLHHVAQGLLTWGDVVAAYRSAVGDSDGHVADVMYEYWTDPVGYGALGGDA